MQGYLVTLLTTNGMANFKVDFQYYDRLAKTVYDALKEQKKRAIKTTLKEVVAHTLPNKGGMRRLNIKSIKTLQNRIKKDWLGKDGKRGSGITTAAFYTKSRVELKGYSPLPVAVQTKAGKQKKIYYKQPTITDADALIKAVNKQTESKRFNEAHYRRSRKDRKSNIFSFIKQLIFTTVGTLRQAAKVSASRAGATIAGWTKAAQLLDLQEFSRALPKNGSYTNLGEAKLTATKDCIKFSATNTALPSKETARRVNAFIYPVQEWYKNAVDAESKRLKQEIKQKLKEVGGDIK